MEISDELRQHLEQNPNIDQVYFNKRGQHFFNAYSVEGKLFSRIGHLWEELKGDYEIVAVLNREQILQHKHHHHHHHFRPILAFNIFNNTQNFNDMAVVTSLTLTSTAPVTLSMTVLDSANGNTPIAGVLSGLAYTPTDPTQDIAVVDPTTATDVDIHAVTPTGGTIVVANGNFVSTLQKTDGSGPVFSGPLPPASLTVVNNVVVAATMAPILAFNQ
jgi:hypothetical protein